MKTCIQCESQFEITPRDIDFLAKFDMPPPSECPGCRARRRWSYRNQNRLYKRKCDFTGEEMISLYSPDKPYKVYKESIWWSDKWDPLKYGRDFDFTRPFFEQFGELLLSVPRRGMHQDGTNEGCEYTTFGMSNKNCYLAFACFYCEDVYYSSWAGMAKDCMDTLICFEENSLLYECIDCKRCYECLYCYQCQNCSECYLLDNCRNCKKCICCKNLRGKEYHIYNKPVSKEEFENFKNNLIRENLLREKERFDQWKLKLPYIYCRIEESENCVGDNIEFSKNCYECFDALRGAEDSRYCNFSGWKGKTMMDCTMTGKESELVYEMHATITAHTCAFVNFCRIAGNVYYSDCISSCNNCFGCTGLSHKEYCILNKQYTKKEYEILLPKIIYHMKKTDEWGRGMPPSIMPFGYNETLAHDFYPLTRAEALKLGFKWCDYEASAPESIKTIPAGKLPSCIDDVPDDILNWAIKCEATDKLFKIIPQELGFYRRMKLPIPHHHPDERHKRRMALRLPHKLWDRKCGKCGSVIKTSFAPNRKEIVFCEQCYLGEVY